MRYIVTKPVEGGYAWWVIIDTQRNAPGAQFAVDLPDAGKTAYDLCDKLNRKVPV
jgi:hypothetical protein